MRRMPGRGLPKTEQLAVAQLVENCRSPGQQGAVNAPCQHQKSRARACSADLVVILWADRIADTAQFGWIGRPPAEEVYHLDATSIPIASIA